MAKASSFNERYLAGMAALTSLGAVAGLVLTDERHDGFVGGIEIIVLVAAALLFADAGVRTGSAAAGSWPLFAALAATSLVSVLAFLTFMLPDAGGAVIFELAAAATGIILVGSLVKRRG